MLTEAELNPNDVRRLRMTLAHSFPFTLFPDLQVYYIPLSFLKGFIEKYRFVNKIYILLHFNPFVPSATFLYPFKTSEKLTIFWCFQGVEKGCIGKKCVKYHLNFRKFIFFLEKSKIS